MSAIDGLFNELDLLMKDLEKYTSGEPNMPFIFIRDDIGYVSEWTKPAAEEYAALKARAENAEAIVIEVDALSQADKQPRSYEEASLAVVRMMAEGVAAMNELQNAEAERDALKAEMDSEVEEFNSGYSAFERGEPIENEYLYDHKHDVWSTGWVWAQHLKAGAK